MAIPKGGSVEYQNMVDLILLKVGDVLTETQWELVRQALKVPVKYRDAFKQEYLQDWTPGIEKLASLEVERQRQKQRLHPANYGFRGLSLNFHGVEGGRLTAFKNNWDIGKQDSQAVYYSGNHGQYFIVDDLDDDRDTHAEWRALNKDYKS